MLSVEGSTARFAVVRGRMSVLLVLVEGVEAAEEQAACLAAMRHGGGYSRDLYDDEDRSAVCELRWCVVAAAK